MITRLISLFIVLILPLGVFATGRFQPYLPSHVGVSLQQYEEPPLDVQVSMRYDLLSTQTPFTWGQHWQHQGSFSLHFSYQFDFYALTEGKGMRKSHPVVSRGFLPGASLLFNQDFTGAKRF